MVNLRMARVLVSGASGLVGSVLVPSLKIAGAHGVRLARSGTAQAAPPHEERIMVNPSQPISPEAVSGFDPVIHLAGESIVGRWTDEKKARIRESQIPATTYLAQALAQAKDKPDVFLFASPI